MGLIHSTISAKLKKIEALSFLPKLNSSTHQIPSKKKFKLPILYTLIIHQTKIVKGERRGREECIRISQSLSLGVIVTKYAQMKKLENGLELGSFTFTTKSILSFRRNYLISMMSYSHGTWIPFVFPWRLRFAWFYPSISHTPLWKCSAITPMFYITLVKLMFGSVPIYEGACDMNGLDHAKVVHMLT